MKLNDLSKVAKFLNTHRIILTCIFSCQVEIIVCTTDHLKTNCLYCPKGDFGT